MFNIVSFCLFLYIFISYILLSNFVSIYPLFFSVFYFFLFFRSYFVIIYLFFVIYYLFFLRKLFVLTRNDPVSLFYLYFLKRFSFDTGQDEMHCLENRFSILGEGKHLSPCSHLFLFSSLFLSFPSSSFFSILTESLCLCAYDYQTSL